jgi:hypothetical protein
MGDSNRHDSGARSASPEATVAGPVGGVLGLGADVLVRLFDLVSQPGIESKSLAEISKVTGAGVRSLARLFPEGGADLVTALVGDVSSWFGENILSILRTNRPPEERIRMLYAQLERVVQGSERSFLLTILALDTGNENVRASIAYGLVQYVGTIATLLEMTGQDAEQSKRRAEDSVIRVQGAAVYSRITGNPEVLLRVLREIPGQLLAPGLPS